jgi:MFS family permease
MNPNTRWALAALSLSTLLSSLGSSIANIGLPTLAQAFGASFAQVQWVVLAYLLAITALIVGAGRLGDLAGRRRLLLAGIALFTLASLLCGLAPTLGLLIAARALQGLGAAVMLALGMAFVAGTVAPGKTGSAMGLLGTMSAIGTAAGPTLGGALIAAFGWQALFLLNVPLGLVALLLARRYLPADAPRGPGPQAAAGPGPLGLVRDPALRAGLAMSALVSTVVMTTLVVGPFYLSGGLGLAITQAGLVMSCGPMVAAAAGLPAGGLVDRFGAPRMAVAGLLAVLAGCLLMTVGARFGAAGYVAPLVLLTAGYAQFQAANNTAVMTHAGAGHRGAVSGLLNLSRNLGLITGASVMGGIFSLAVGAAGPTSASAPALANGLRVSFAAAALLAGIALVIAFARPAAATASAGAST